MSRQGVSKRPWVSVCSHDDNDFAYNVLFRKSSIDTLLPSERPNIRLTSYSCTIFGSRHRPCVLLFMARAKRNRNAKKFHGKRILVVEDHSLISEVLIDLLKRYGHPSHAQTGNDALQQIKKKAPDVILLDLSLPDMNGLELAKVVRRNDKTNSIPILAMSASPADRKKCLQMGCNDFILKPFSVSGLLVRLSALISPS
jgi:CheY-like chemotaxis protein